MSASQGRDYVAEITTYARDVVEGRVLAGRFVKLACKRHLDDLAADPNFPYYFDEGAARRICGFAELLPHIKGEWAKHGELVVLGRWQCFFLGVPFGWKRKADGYRRFREIYGFIPRKNGKSMLGAIIGLYMFLADDEHGAEVYSGATTEKQAWEVFGPARLMLKNSPDICEDAGVYVGAKNLSIEATASKFEPLIGNPGDGSSPHCAVIDEYHEHQTSNQYDTMVSGMGARKQPMIVIITTAGVSLAGPCYDKHLQAKALLEGTDQNDELFAILYTIDEELKEGDEIVVKGDDWADPQVLEKANPNFGVSVDASFLLSQQRQAVRNPENQNRFRTKHLDVWCSAKVSYFNAHKWSICADPMLTLEELAGERVRLILDLASRTDLCVLMALFKRPLRVTAPDGSRVVVPHYYAFGKYYLPESAIEAQGPNRTNYIKWRNQGLLTQHDGNEIDFDLVRDDVLAMGSKFDVIEVAYDQWRAAQLAQQLTKESVKCVEYPQRVQTMSLPMKELKAAIDSSRFHHNGDPIMTWTMGNVVAKEDAKENVYPRREKPHLKIDPMVGLIMGMGRAMLEDTDDEGISGWLKDPVV